jgi:hypothetical protein
MRKEILVNLLGVVLTVATVVVTIAALINIL